MAKVLFILPIGMDMGGIITSSREMCAGLKAAGHEVQFATAHFGSTDRPVGQAARGKYERDFVWDDATEAMYHPMLGWREEPRFNLATDLGLARFLSRVQYFKYDIIIWGALFPFADADPDYWLEAFRGHRAKNIVMIHDDHLTSRYPWALALSGCVDGYVGMFQAAYDSLEPVQSSRALIYNPIAPPPPTVASYDRRKGFLSMQVWKPWKNADKLVAAAPSVKSKITFAGDGIQLRYIRSIDKCPPKFQGLWAGATHRHDYAGVVDEKGRTDLLRRSRFLVDLSYRPGNTGQINTMVQQAIAEGCVVIANPNFLGTSPFKPMKHYIPITEDQYEPLALAAALNRIDKEIKGDRYTAIQDNARVVLGALFERTHIGACMVNFGLTSKRKAPTKAQKQFFVDQFGEGII